MKSQEDKILEQLKRSPGGISPTHIIKNMNIFQYNRAIYNLKKRFNCTCKRGQNIPCLADEHIVNEKIGKGTRFFYIDQRKPIKMEKDNRFMQECFI